MEPLRVQHIYMMYTNSFQLKVTGVMLLVPNLGTLLNKVGMRLKLYA
jgi:hypothetical protein